MKEIKRSLKFILEKRKKNGILVTENVPIRLIVRYNSNRVDLTTGFRVNEKDWNHQSQKVKKNLTIRSGITSTKINKNLAVYYSKVQDIFDTASLKNYVPEPDELKSKFNSIKNGGAIETEKNSFFKVFDEFVRYTSERNEWTRDTHKKYNSIKNHLERFDSEMTFEKLNHQYLMEYMMYLRNERHMRNSTIRKNLRFVNGFFNYGLNFKHHDNKDFKTFKPKLKTSEKKVIYLTKEDKDKIKNLKIPNSKSNLEFMRDVLFFLCFTGLRHSDVLNLKREHIKKDAIVITTKKSTKNINVDLNNESRRILNKYKNTEFIKGRILPVISLTNSNLQIKELCQMAEIDEPIEKVYFKGNKRITEVKPKYEYCSTHLGRKTFIVTALSLSIPPQIVMKWTGHRNYNTMLPYIDIINEAKVSAMDKFNTL